jgi:N-acetyl-1-D-myo-inositol-2-amino-2-deoxy-alpha-D-glucopyranoside deacetylase
MNDVSGLLLVHAHPDDEIISTGATIARYTAAGAGVCLVTCTRGEYGEIVDDELVASGSWSPERLGEHRMGEMKAALAQLGNPNFEWLGGAGRWWDSGMVGTPQNDGPRAFYRADPAETTRALVEILRRERPAVVVTYDQNGGYGHPDHIQAHRVTMDSIDPAADPEFAPELGQPWQVRKVYWAVVPRENMRQIAEMGGMELSDLMPGVPYDQITARVDGRELVSTKRAALIAHRSQVDLSKGMFSMIANRPEFGYEHFQLVRGERGPAGPGEYGWEDDLFAGLG